MRRFLVRSFALLTLAARTLPVLAGVEGQPQPDAVLKVKLSNAARWFQTPQKNVGQERADFLMLLEKSPAADITDLIAPALIDTAAYQGALATFEDTLDNAKDEATRLYLRYNIARTHLLKAKISPASVGRNPYAEAAYRALQPFDTKTRDAALWELLGDIEAERGNTDQALIAYGKITGAGGSAAYADGKSGLAWQRVRRYTEARAAFERAAQRDASSATGGGETYHWIQQSLAGLYLEQRDFRSALLALDRSTKLRPEHKVFPFRLEVARALLKRGYRTEVVSYLQAAIKQMPEDAAAKALLAEASQTR